MKTITTVDRLTRKEFFNEFVKQNKPVLITKQTENWPARKLWSAEYFKQQKLNVNVVTKPADVSKGHKESIKLSKHVARLIKYEEELKAGKNPIAPDYLHDFPIFHVLPELLKDIEPFPLELFPKWYWKNYQNYIQFFMGATNSFTPLHFDTLCTHNLFFQMVGSKKFTLIDYEQKELCYMKSWRWAEVNPDSIDFSKFPKASSLHISEVIVSDGDMLYMPAGMLHQVTGLSYSVSFNIDWHTAKSAANGVVTKLKGAPWKNAYYNWLVFMGLSLKVPSKVIFPYYKSYLNYVS